MAACSSPSFLSIISSTATGTNIGHGSGIPMMSPAASVRCRPVSVSASCATTAKRPPPAFTSHHIASTSSLYAVLGIRNDATCHEIKTAYRRLARVLHPDVTASSTSSSGDGKGHEFTMLHKAYATLSDPDKRADYDRAMMVVAPRPSSVRAGCGSVFRTRRWETDQCW